MKINYFASPFWTFGVVAALAAPALADNVLTTHRLSAGLAAEAVTEAVAVCANQGYKVTAAIVDTDGVVQALLRGDDASMVAFATASDKAFTVLMLGAARNEDSSGAMPSVLVTHLRPAASLRSSTYCYSRARCASKSATTRLPRSASVVRLAVISTKRAPRRGSTRSAIASGNQSQRGNRVGECPLSGE